MYVDLHAHLIHCAVLTKWLHDALTYVSFLRLLLGSRLKIATILIHFYF